MATKKQPKYIVLDSWRETVYTKYGFYPQLNRHKEQWPARDLVESFGLDTVLDLIEYYVSIAPDTPKWETFKWRADDLLTQKNAEEQDQTERAENRKKARAWLQT